MRRLRKPINNEIRKFRGEDSLSVHIRGPGSFKRFLFIMINLFDCVLTSSIIFKKKHGKSNDLVPSVSKFKLDS